MPMTNSRALGLFILLGIPALYLAVFFITPMLHMVLFSFWRQSQVGLVAVDWTLDNYREIISPYYMRLFLRTIRVAAVTTLACAIIGFPIAYFIARARPTMKSIAIFLVMSPLMVSTVVRVFGTTLIIGNTGILNQFLMDLGFSRIRIIQTEMAIVIGLVQMLLPLMVLPIVSAIERIPRNLEEAACTLGAGWFRIFTTTIFPLSLPGLISGSILTYSLAVSALVIPALLGGAGDRMLGQQIYDQMFVAYNWPAAATLSVVLVIVTAIAATIGLAATARLSATRQGK
jgi:ABC-type spermidine/putrescine transport system permease subunit I